MKLLDTGSLAVTLRNLEEGRLGGATARRAGVREALDWVAGRQTAARGYGPRFAATEADADEMHPTLTREHANRACTKLILGLEAARALWLWGRRDGWQAAETFEVIRDKDRRWPPPRLGYACCEGCSVSRWRALLAARPQGWEEVIAAGLRELAARNLVEDGRWRKFPFFYTLLALAEMPSELVVAERKRIRPAAERARGSLTGDDAPTRFRRRAVEWALAY